MLCSKCGQEVACAIAEGYDADIVVADKPEELHVEKIYAKVTAKGHAAEVLASL